LDGSAGKVLCFEELGELSHLHPFDRDDIICSTEPFELFQPPAVIVLGCQR
jgi:hypothetical protein